MARPALYSMCTPIRAHNLTKHANSKVHIAACRLFIARSKGIPLTSSIAQPGLVGSPPMKEFEDLVKSIASPEMSKDLGVSQRRRALMWCLTEGKMDMERPLLQHARSICFSQDERLGDLIMHASACTSKMSKLRCYLGTMKCLGTDAYDIVKTTEAIIDRFCTPRANPPRYGRLQQQCTSQRMAQIDANAKDGILDASELMSTDAASNELRVGRLLSGRSASDLVKPIFTKFVDHVKDPGHAGGRFLKTWDADQFMSAVFDLFIAEKGSITNLIQHSPDIQRIFSKHVGAIPMSDEAGSVSGAAMHMRVLRLTPQLSLSGMLGHRIYDVRKNKHY